MNNLWEAFCITVKRVSERAAIITSDQTHSFAQLAIRASDFRHAYHKAGVQRSDRVLLWMENSYDMAAAVIACWGQDAIPVLIDASCRRPQLAHALELIEPRVVVHTVELPGPVDDPAVTVMQTAEVPSYPEGKTLPTSPRALPTDPASIVFTSGSTGLPKGVVQSHGNIYHGCITVHRYLGLRDDDVLLCPVPWSFDYGYGQLLTTLLCGITHLIPPANTPFGICAAIEEQHPSVFAGTPALFSYLMSGMSPIRSTNVSSLRLLTNTGGKLAASVLSNMLEAFDGADVVLNYGLTETYRSCYLPPHLVREHPHSLGIAIPGVGIEILREDGSRASAHEEGEIVHRGNFVCLGYWRNSESTAAVIRRDPLAPQGVISDSPALFTGDIGYVDERGFFYFVARRDRLLKSMGVRVSPHEVEEILIESGQVVAAAVFGRPHDLLGHEIHAAVVPRDPERFNQRDLDRFARSNMSQYLLPRFYLVLNELPHTTSGKTDFPALEKIASDVRADQPTSRFP